MILQAGYLLALNRAKFEFSHDSAAAEDTERLALWFELLLQNRKRQEKHDR